MHFEFDVSWFLLILIADKMYCSEKKNDNANIFVEKLCSNNFSTWVDRVFRFFSGFLWILSPLCYPSSCWIWSLLHEMFVTIHYNGANWAHEPLRYPNTKRRSCPWPLTGATNATTAHRLSEDVEGEEWKKPEQMGSHSMKKAPVLCRNGFSKWCVYPVATMVWHWHCFH